jgi:16S rRNA (cytosine1402-N4)-methyltransferase
MLDEVLAALQPRSGGRYLDATVGGGGHSQAILQASRPAGRLLGTDADTDAIVEAARRLADDRDRATLKQCWLDQAPDMAMAEGMLPLDGILVDLGLSSNQLDDPERGMSFMRPGPLDMRFDRSRGASAADLIDASDVHSLMMILREYGEVANARRVAEAIWSARPLRTTTDLRAAVEKSVAPRPGARARIHPATQVFQAFRIAVNDELRRLADALPLLIGALGPGGRLAVISFHSLEDRIVKDRFRFESRAIDDQPGFGPAGIAQPARVILVTRKPMAPSPSEVERNPRARSARLRVVERAHGAGA